MIKTGYEIIYIVNPDVPSLDVVKKKIAALLGEKEIKHQDLGLKKFAYAIKKKTSGHYFLLRVQKAGKQIKKFVDEVRWMPEVLRFLVVNLAKEKHFRFSSPKKVKLNEDDSVKSFLSSDRMSEQE